MDILQSDFNPIEFLEVNISSLSKEEIAKLDDELRKQIGEYIMLKIFSILTGSQLDQLGEVGDREKILEILKASIHDFDKRIEKELDNFKLDIKLIEPSLSEISDKVKRVVNNARFNEHQQTVRRIGIIAIVGMGLLAKGSVSSSVSQKPQAENADLAEKEASIKAQIAQIIKGEKESPLSEKEAVQLSYDLICIDQTIKAWMNPKMLYKYPQLNLKDEINDYDRLKYYRDKEYLFENNPVDKRKVTDRVVTLLLEGGKGGKVITAYRDSSGHIYKARIAIRVEESMQADLKQAISGLYNIPNQVQWEAGEDDVQIKGIGKTRDFNVELKAGKYMEINVEQLQQNQATVSN